MIVLCAVMFNHIKDHIEILLACAHISTACSQTIIHHIVNFVSLRRVEL